MGLIPLRGASYSERTIQGQRQTGWAAYRLRCDKEFIAGNPLTTDLVNNLDSNLWVGEGRLLMTYLVKDAKVLNMVASHKDDVDTNAWTESQYRAGVKVLFQDFEPKVQVLLRMANDKIANWPVYEVPGLKTWRRLSGSFVLVGDGAHAMAFYLSMSVSLACEDGAALAEVLELVCQDSAMPQEHELIEVLEIFEKVRKPRAEAVQQTSLHAGDVIHFEDGRRTDVRNKALALGNETDEPLTADNRECVYVIADKTIRDWCYGYDAGMAVRNQ